MFITNERISKQISTYMVFFCYSDRIIKSIQPANIAVRNPITQPCKNEALFCIFIS